MTTYQRYSTFFDNNREEITFTLLPIQVTALDTLLGEQIAAAENDFPNNPGSHGAPIYQLLLDYILDINNKPYSLVDPRTVAWLSGAVKVNNHEGYFADFIFEYTAYQQLLRYGSADGVNVLLQDASNDIAFKLAEDIIENSGRMPDIEGLGAIDAGSVASGLFSDDYTPWAGTLLFPFLH